MAVSAKKRRRWPWIVLAGLLLLVGGPIAWRLRPLSAAERTLVGRWRTADGLSSFELSPDRRFHWESVDKGFVYGLSATHRAQPLLFHMVDSRFLTMDGHWSGTRSSLSFRDDVERNHFPFLPWLSRVRAYAVVTFASTAELQWNGPDRFELCGQEFTRVQDEGR